MYQLSMYVKIVEYSKKSKNCAAKQSNREKNRTTTKTVKRKSLAFLMSNIAVHQWCCLLYRPQ